jgi:ABC-2 type transport system ATP-binding protein
MPAAVSSPAFEAIGKNDHELIVKIKEGHTANEVLQYFIEQHNNIRSFNEMLPSLNDIFIKLVEGTPLSRQFEKITA